MLDELPAAVIKHARELKRIRLARRLHRRTGAPETGDSGRTFCRNAFPRVTQCDLCKL